MNPNNVISSFVSALEQAGVSVKGEETLSEKLLSSKDPEVELIKIASNDRFSGVVFTPTPEFSEKKLSEAFREHGFDGFAYKDFLELLNQKKSAHY